MVALKRLDSQASASGGAPSSEAFDKDFAVGELDG
jgi:hypothetical protein